MFSDRKGRSYGKRFVRVKQRSTVLPNCESSAKELINDLAAALNAEAVIAIGNKIVLYRYSKKEGVKHLEI